MAVLCLVAAAGGSCSKGQQPAAQALAAAVQLPVVAQNGAALSEVGLACLKLDDSLLAGSGLTYVCHNLTRLLNVLRLKNCSTAAVWLTSS